MGNTRAFTRVLLQNTVGILRAAAAVRPGLSIMDSVCSLFNNSGTLPTSFSHSKSPGAIYSSSGEHHTQP